MGELKENIFDIFLIQKSLTNLKVNKYKQANFNEAIHHINQSKYREKKFEKTFKNELNKELSIFLNKFS